MSGTQSESNFATVSGRIVAAPVFSHEVYGEGFYYFFIDVKRLSDSQDRIPVMFSERLVDPSECEVGKYVYIEGQYRSYNQTSENRSKLMLMVFARDVQFEGDVNFGVNAPCILEGIDCNNIVLNGYICKAPIYRKTPFNREIADLLLAVNRSYNKSDYIPCISWGRNARYCAGRAVGDNVRITGRIQSRTYQKKLPDGTTEDRMAYEVSVIRLELVGQREQVQSEIE